MQQFLKERKRRRKVVFNVSQIYLKRTTIDELIYTLLSSLTRHNCIYQSYSQSAIMFFQISICIEHGNIRPCFVNIFLSYYFLLFYSSVLVKFICKCLFMVN